MYVGNFGGFSEISNAYFYVTGAGTTTVVNLVAPGDPIPLNQLFFTYELSSTPLNPAPTIASALPVQSVGFSSVTSPPSAADIFLDPEYPENYPYSGTITVITTGFLEDGEPDLIVPFNGNTVTNLTYTITQTPGPLPILGAGAAFGFSRKLRRRIKVAS